MIKSYKVRLEPTKQQRELMFKSSGCSRFVYNWCLAFQKERYENGEKFVSAMGMSKYLTQLKKEKNYSWLKEVDSIALVQAYTDACNAFKNFFREIKKGNKNQGYPRFKSKKHSKPSFMPNYQEIKFSENQVKLSKIGLVKLSRKNYIPIVDKYCNPRITFDGLNWYISVGVDIDPIGKELHGVIGVDLG
ncbi:MAG: RNA-guided endonuclease InsQ/TnpB family protein, partial [Intestinibacter sp.]